MKEERIKEPERLRKERNCPSVLLFTIYSLTHTSKRRKFVNEPEEEKNDKYLKEVKEENKEQTSRS